MVIYFMILLHIIDDFVLQPICLSKLKQKGFWKDYISEENQLYKYDYIAALFIHGLSWSIMIHLPILCTCNFKWWVHMSVIINALIHSYIDHKKANKKTINLCVDQTLHLTQIVLTYYLFF